MSSSIVRDQKYKNRQKRKDAIITIFIALFAFIWMIPILWTLWTSLRPYEDIIQKGAWSRPYTLNLNNYVEAFRLMEIWGYLSNSFIVAIPAVILTLFLAHFWHLLSLDTRLDLISISCCYLLLEISFQFSWSMPRYLRCISGLVI